MDPQILPRNPIQGADLVLRRIKCHPQKPAEISEVAVHRDFISVLHLNKTKNFQVHLRKGLKIRVIDTVVLSGNVCLEMEIDSNQGLLRFFIGDNENNSGGNLVLDHEYLKQWASNPVIFEMGALTGSSGEILAGAPCTQAEKIFSPNIELTELGDQGCSEKMEPQEDLCGFELLHDSTCPLLLCDVWDCWWGDRNSLNTEYLKASGFTGISLSEWINPNRCDGTTDSEKFGAKVTRLDELVPKTYRVVSYNSAIRHGIPFLPATVEVVKTDQVSRVGSDYLSILSTAETKSFGVTTVLLIMLKQVKNDVLINEFATQVRIYSKSEIKGKLLPHGIVLQKTLENLKKFYENWLQTLSGSAPKKLILEKIVEQDSPEILKVCKPHESDLNPLLDTDERRITNQLSKKEFLGSLLIGIGLLILAIHMATFSFLIQTQMDMVKMLGL